MGFLMEYWYILVAAVCAVGVMGVMVGKFLNLPTKDQIEKAKEWLLLAVVNAEKELGSGTGQLKLRSVYDLFIQRFGWMAQAISFDTFSLWVDEALEKMEDMLKNNKAVRKYVEESSGDQEG